MSNFDWKDISSRREGKSWEVRSGPLRVIVTRRHGLPPDKWYLICDAVGIELRELGHAEIAKARDEAFLIVEEELEEMLYGLRDACGVDETSRAAYLAGQLAAIPKDLRETLIKALDWVIEDLESGDGDYAALQGYADARKQLEAL